VTKARAANVGSWPIASFRVRATISRFWGQADIGRKHMVTLPEASSHLVI